MGNLIILKSFYGVKYLHGSAYISALHLHTVKQPRILKKKKKNKSFQSLLHKLQLKLNFV